MNTTRRPARLNRRTLDVVADLVAVGTVSKEDADIFVSAATVYAAVVAESRRRERVRRRALPWWVRLREAVVG